MTQNHFRYFIRQLSFVLIASASLFAVGCSGAFWGRYSQPVMAVPDVYPLGSITRSHFHTMQENAEAADFILHRCDFVGSTAQLTPFGRDRILEIAARMRNAPYPVLVERSENNSDPELDSHRRELIVRVLFDHGMPEAAQRVFVSPAYGVGRNSRAAEADFYQGTFSRGNNGQSNGGNNTGGFGGGGFGFGGGNGFNR